MCNLSVCTLLLIFVASFYISGSTKAASNDDDDFLQAINLANSPNVSPKPYTPIQEQQKQQLEKQQQQQHLQKHPNKRSLLASEAATTLATTRIRQKRSQHSLTNSEEYLRNMPTYAYNLAMLNMMHSLKKQLSNIDLARLRSRLGSTAAADLQLFNEIYNSNNYNNRATLFNGDESAALNVGESGSSNDNGGGGGGGGDTGFASGATGLIGTGTGHGGLGLLGGIGDAGAANDLLANDIEDLSVPWQFVGRVSKKSSALYKPRLGKRTQKRQQQEPMSCK